VEAQEVPVERGGPLEVTASQLNVMHGEDVTVTAHRSPATLGDRTLIWPFICGNGNVQPRNNLAIKG
jgi:hypothetical protein